MARTAAKPRFAESVAALRIPNFRYLFLSNIALNFAGLFQIIGLGWLVYELTGSAAQMGTITAIQGAVMFLSSPLAGILSDRINRRYLLLATTAVSAAQAVTLAALVGTGWAQPWHLYAYAVVGGAAQALTQPVRQAFIHDTVGREGVARAIPINNLSFSGARAIGPAIAGAVIGFTGTANVFYVQGVLTAIAMTFTLLIGETQQVTASRQESPWKTLAEGVRYASTNDVIRGQLITGMVLTLLVYPYVQFLPFFAGKMDVGAQGYGILFTGAGYGGVIGLFILMWVGEVKRKGRLLLLAQGFYPITVLLFTFTTSIPTAMVFLIGAGFCNSFYMAMQNTLFLVNAREDMRGRVMSLYTMAGGLGPIGSLTLGLAISAWGVAEAVRVFMVLAAGLVVLSVLSFPAVRRA